MKLEITDKIKDEDEKMIFQGLLEYNLARIEDKNPKDLGIYLQNGTSKKLAGLIGNGYKEVFALEEYPVTGKRYYFTKTL